MNQKAGTLPKPFSIDPPNAGTVTNASAPKTHELSRAFASQIILMGDSITQKSFALPSSPTICQIIRIFRRFIQQHPRTIFPKSTHWKNKQKMISHVRSQYSQAYKVITPFCMTRFANWKLAPTIQSYGGYHRYGSSSIQQNQPIASLNLLMIRRQVSGALFSELINMATVSSSDFNFMELILEPDILQHSSSSSSLGTTMVFYDGHFLSLFS